MRGSDERSGELFSYVDLEDRVPAGRPLRLIRRIVNEVLAALDGEFTKLYADGGRPSIAPERLLRALLLQVFYTIRSERQLMEQLHYNLLYRWFVGLGVENGIRQFERLVPAGCRIRNEATKAAQRAGIEHAKGKDETKYLGRKPSYTRQQFTMVRHMLGHEAVGIARIAKETGLTRQTVYRIKDDPAGSEAALAAWGL
jgi:transposase